MRSKMSDSFPWRQRRPANRAATSLFSHSKAKSSFNDDSLCLEDVVDEVIIDSNYSPLDTIERGYNNTEGGIPGDDVAQDSSSSSASRAGLWGMPVGSIILLNLVAVIWGTQHAVIKSVVDDSNAVIGLGTGFFKWMEDAGVNLGTVQNGVASTNVKVADAAGGESTAAFFTLARFGLAALLASPYTPGWRLLVDSAKDKLGIVESTTVSDDVNKGEEKRRPLQHDSSGSENAGAVTTSSRNDGESISLAWKYGAELGIYMFLGYAFQAIGLETTTASRSGFLLYLNVKFVPFFSYFLFGKRIQRSTWISALAAFAGTALLALDNASVEKGLGMAFTVGDLWSIAAAAASAMFILRMEAASNAVPESSELNAATLWIVAVLSLLWTTGISWNDIEVNAETASVFVQAIQHTVEQTVSTIIRHPLPLIYLSGVTTALANYLQSKAQKDISAERASVIYAMDPVYGAIFANILLGEELGPLGLVGAFVIFVAAATNAVFDFGVFSGDKVDGMSNSTEAREGRER